MERYQRIVAEINLDALKQNIKEIQKSFILTVKLSVLLKRMRMDMVL